MTQVRLSYLAFAASLGCMAPTASEAPRAEEAALTGQARAVPSVFDGLTDVTLSDPDGQRPWLGGRADSPTRLCAPTAGGPYFIEEGQTIVVKLSCLTGLSTAGLALSVSPMPFGANFNSTDHVFRWTPGLDQAGVYEIALGQMGVADKGSFKIGVADLFDDPANKPIADITTYTEEMGLPVFHLQTSPEINSTAHTPARVFYRGKSYPGAEAKFHGRSSLGYPKKSYTMKFPREALFSDQDQAGGFNGKRRVVLISTFDDNSYIRQRLSFDVWNRLGTIRIQSYSAVLYVNGAYQGIYTAADVIDEDLMRSAGLSDGGSLYKSVGHEANFISKDDVKDAYEKKAGAAPDTEDLFSDITELTDFINNSDDETFRNDVGQKLDLRDYWAWLITVTAINASDSFGKNAYHYHTPDGGLWKVAPWDFNASFGQGWDTNRAPTDGDPVEVAHGFNRLFARFFDDEVIGRRTRDRYAEAISNQISLQVVMGSVNQMLTEVSPGTGRDQRRWQAGYRSYENWSYRTDFTDFDGEAEYLRKWIADRWAYLQKMM